MLLLSGLNRNTSATGATAASDCACNSGFFGANDVTPACDRESHSQTLLFAAIIMISCMLLSACLQLFRLMMLVPWHYRKVVTAEFSFSLSPL